MEKKNSGTKCLIAASYPEERKLSIIEHNQLNNYSMKQLQKVKI
jgi:hypothetical protein